MIPGDLVSSYLRLNSSASSSLRNPLFIRECLKSLVDRDLLQYSFRERRWVWDADKIAVGDIASSNVCDLLLTKMIRLPENTQLALKVASSFGSEINLKVIKVLVSASPLFSRLMDGFVQAVEEGFMNKDDLGTYKFAHDKFREAAYSLIREDTRSQVG